MSVWIYYSSWYRFVQFWTRFTKNFENWRKILYHYSAHKFNMSGYIYFFTRCFDRWRLKREHFIWTHNSRTNKRFYNVVTTELQSFTPDKMYNALKFMLNPFVQLKVMQCLKINFETLDYFVFFHTKSLL